MSETVGPAWTRPRPGAYDTGPTAISLPRVATVSRWSAGTTPEYRAVQQEGQQYCRNTTGAST